jgi:hypothetical protein
MAQQDNLAQVLSYFGRERKQLHKIVAALVEDAAAAEAVMAEAQEIYAAISADTAYLDDPGHSMAGSLFYCNLNLAVYLALRPLGVGAHEFGNAVLANLATAPLPHAEVPEEGNSNADFAGPGTHPGEFEVEVVPSDDASSQWGFNIKSCAICHQYGKYDAMDLVPYMCASDDVVSDIRGQGLRRSGTIALGATHCDFRFEIGGEPQRLATAYPEKIKFEY